MNLHPQAKSVWGILIACSISGLISGSLVTKDFRSDFLTFGWASQAGPGIVFGLVFSIVSIGTYLQHKDHKPVGAITFICLFTIASTIIYFIAFEIAMWTIMLLDKSNSNGFVAGGLAGSFGAGVLAITAKLLSETQINFRDEIITMMAGTITGMIFFLWMEGSIDYVNWSLRFVIWQVAVGWSLSRSMQKGPIHPINLNENMKSSHNNEMA